MQEKPPKGPALARPARWAVAGLSVLLGACASVPPPQRSTPPPGAAPTESFDRDGPPASPPPDLALVPDAEPRIEPIRVGGPNKPYEVLGRGYVPITVDRPVSERGLASWYGRKFHGRRTASGEVYDMYAMTAAHPTLPLPSYVRVRNLANDREVVVRVNDRGPFHPGRVIDLSYTAAWKLDLLRGVAHVELERITFDEIRTGAWRRDGPTAIAIAAAPITSTTTATSVPMLEPVVASGDEIVAAAFSSAPPASASPTGFWLQLGAFRQRDAAEGLQRQVGAELGWLAPLLAVVGDTALYRLQAGPYPNRADARSAAQRIRDAVQLAPVIVERR